MFKGKDTNGSQSNFSLQNRIMANSKRHYIIQFDLVDCFELEYLCLFSFKITLEHQLNVWTVTRYLGRHPMLPQKNFLKNIIKVQNPKINWWGFFGTKYISSWNICSRLSTIFSIIFLIFFHLRWNWHNSIPQLIMSMLCKQTKSENILVILDFELQTDVILSKETKDWRNSCASKEKPRKQHCYHGDKGRQTNDIFTESVSFLRW